MIHTDCIFEYLIIEGVGLYLTASLILILAASSFLEWPRDDPLWLLTITEPLDWLRFTRILPAST